MPRKPVLWTQSAMRRIFPLDPPPRPRPRPVALSAARGETECFQVGVHAGGLRYNYMLAEVSDLKTSRGETIPADAADVFYPEYVPVKWAVKNQRPGDVERVAPAFFPDPLPTRWEFDVAGPCAPPTRSVWVRLRVPEDAAPGVYRGTVTVTVGWRNYKAENQEPLPDSVKTAGVAFRLRVWNFALQRKTSLLTTNWFFPNILPLWYEPKPWGAAFWKLVERFADDMAAHRQNVILTPLVRSDNLDTALIDITKRGRRYAFDFRRFDRWCRLFFKRGFELIEGQHFCSASSVVTGLARRTPSGAKKPLVFENAQDPAYEDFLRQFLKALSGHLSDRGWLDRYVQHISDEPDTDQIDKYRRLAAIVRESAPGVRVIDAVGLPEFGNVMDIPVPIESKYEETLGLSGRSPEEVWTYYCCGPSGPWPNRFLDYPLIRLRIITWLCFQKRIPGFLHWAYNYWKAKGKRFLNPWSDPTGDRWPGGDTVMVYPPRYPFESDEIVGSIRWEIVREALEDYEYLTLTRALAEDGDVEAEAILHDVARDIVPDWTTHTRDDAALETMRSRMGGLLSKRL